MKKTFLFLLLLATGLPALAQIEKGNVMLGGTLDGYWSRSQSTAAWSFPSSQWGGNLSPNISYFVTKGLALGAVTSYGRYWSRQESDALLPNGTPAESRTRSHNFSLGPALHYYIMLGDKLAVYAQTSLAWGNQRAAHTLASIDSNGVTTLVQQRSDAHWRVFAAGPGLAYFLNPHVALLGGITYRNHRYVQEKSESTQNQDIVNTSASAFLNVGVQAFLPTGRRWRCPR